MLLAHGLAGRADLPIPSEWFGVAAAVVLVVSFAGLAAGWSTPRLEEPRERRLFRLPRAVDVVLGAIGVAAFALTVYAGLAGTDSQQDNLAPTMVYVAFWVGVAFAQLVLGDVWRLLSPWRALGRAAGWLAGRMGGGAEPLPYPERLGSWPAVAGLVAFGVAELCWAPARDPQPLAILMIVYVAVQVVGMALYGVEAWTRRGDAFGVWFSLLARFAPLARRDGVLYARPPGVAAAQLRAVPGTVWVLLTGIGVTAFDGAREGPIFGDVAPELQQALVDLGLGLGPALEWTFFAGMMAVLALVALTYGIGVEGMPRTERARTRPQLARAFAHTLIPIAAAYLVAHYFSLLAYNGQDVWRLLREPLDGGGTGPEIDYGVVSATAIWYVQVVTLVVGHVTALVLAHDRAIALYGSAKGAARSQVVMLAVMVAFTCLGLYLLSAANA